MTKNNIELKRKLINTIMKCGKKKTSEKILIKCLKSIQKSSKKNHINLLKQSIINSTPTFKINIRSKKRGKKKSNQEIPTFIRNNLSRTIMALNFLILNSHKNQESLNFYKKVTQEILNTFLNKSKTIEQKTRIQEQVLTKKRYLNNFRW